MDECFLYRNPPFSFPYAGLFNPLRNFHDNQFAITGPDGEGKRGKEEERKRREKKRLSQILYSDNRRQRLNERLRAKLENRKTKDEKFETQEENNILSEEDLVTLFDSQDKPKKRKRKKRKNKKKKKKGENKEMDCKAEEAEGSGGAGAGASESCSPREALNESLESVVSELSEVDDLLSESFAKSPVEDKDVISVFVLEKDAENQADVEVEEVPLSSDEDLICVAGAMVAREEAEEKVEECLEEISRIADEAGEESGKCENISCGDSTSSTERSTSEHDEKEAGETVSDDGEHENLENEEDRSTISPEERGNLSEMILDDEFPWHLYHTDDNSYSQTRFDDASFTVVKRKEKRQRKRKPSPPRKKKRKPPRRRESRREKDKKKEKESPTIKRKNTIKNSPRSACPIRPVISISPKIERKPAAMQQNMKGDPTVASPTSPPPGFAGKTPTCPEGVPSLTKPFEQFQAVNALFMKMPQGSIITIPFMPIDGVVDLLPMNLDLSYPLDCTY